MRSAKEIMDRIAYHQSFIEKHTASATNDILSFADNLREKADRPKYVYQWIDSWVQGLQHDKEQIMSHEYDMYALKWVLDEDEQRG